MVHIKKNLKKKKKNPHKEKVDMMEPMLLG